MDASSGTPVDWHDLDWSALQRNVCRIQARIVKATRDDDWRRLRSLQRLLTRSFSGRAMAVRRVTENHGKRTPGVDGELWDTPAKKARAVSTLTPTRYTPSPLRRTYIPKENGRRPLGIPTMKDRAMQAMYLLALDPVAETRADVNSYGFRRERSAADAIQQCIKVLQREHCARWILEADIKSCFDHLSHEWLLRNVPMEKRILRKWLNAGFLEKKRFHPTEEGAPQGGIISPVLCNIALDGLETELRNRFGKRDTGKANRVQVNLIRYADDFIITGRTRDILEREVLPLVERFLGTRGLNLSARKTRITRIEDGFDFLGKNIRKYPDGSFLVKPSKESVQRFHRRVTTIAKSHRQVKTGEFISLLNPVIRGWANYYRHDASSRTFSTVDHLVFGIIWRWCRRRHPKKDGWWIKDKYFPPDGTRRWIFTGETANGETCHLHMASDTRIRRHRKIKGEANPYDPEWRGYFERRRKNLWTYETEHAKKVRTLWLRQEGRCPRCHQVITEEGRWHVHHVIRRADGGTDAMENLQLLHVICHQQHHSHDERRKAGNWVCHKASQRLEPCAGQPARTVLRGGGGGDATPLPGEDIPPLRDDIDPLLALTQKPESLPLAFQAIHAYRVRMQELLEAGKRAEAERTEREVRLNRFDGFTEEASRKIAYNDLAFFRAELARELYEAVAQERQRLKATLHHLAEDEDRSECGG